MPRSLPSLTKAASRSADSAEIKIEGGLKPWNRPYRNSAALRASQALGSGGGSPPGRLLSVSRLRLDLCLATAMASRSSFLWRSQVSDCCFCLTAGQRDDKRASTKCKSVLQSRCSWSLPRWAWFESCGPVVTAKGLSEERTCVLTKASKRTYFLRTSSSQ